MIYEGPKIIELGESEALARALGVFRSVESTLVPSGDDAAVVGLLDPRVVISTDTMVQNHDFDLGWSSAFDLGYKAVTTNLADLVAMGATPRGLTVALVVTKDTRQSWLEEFAKGLQAGCDNHASQCEIVGGDLASGDQLVIAVTAIGDLDQPNPVLRSTAQVGDLVVVAGTLGKAACGLDLLRSADKTLADSYPEYVEIQKRPIPDLVLGMELSRIATSMMDISDGLSLDSARLARKSNVTLRLERRLLEGYAAVLEQAAQSINSRVEGSANQWDWVLHGGEDHSFLATVPPGAKLPRGAKVIGRVDHRAENDIYLDDQPLAAAGWDSVTG